MMRDAAESAHAAARDAPHAGELSIDTLVRPAGSVICPLAVARGGRLRRTGRAPGTPTRSLPRSPALHRRVRPVFAGRRHAARRPSLRWRTRRPQCGRTRARAGLDKGLLASCESIDRARLSRANQIDAAMLDNQLRYSVWSEENYRDWSWDPLIYTQLAGQSLYGLLARDFAPLPQRLRSAHRSGSRSCRDCSSRRAPTSCRHACRRSMPKPRVKQNPGVLSLVDELIVPNLATSRADERARLEHAIAGCAHGRRAHQQWLQTELRAAARRASSGSAASSSTRNSASH